MSLRSCSAALLTSLACVSFALDATAHISLDAPKSRYYSGNVADQSKLKYGPCGVSKDARTTNASLITTFKPGERVTVRFRETVQHPGYFRIAFDSDGQDFTLPGSAMNGDGVTILADKIADKSGASNLEYTYDITLPNVECSKCTLQLVQVMTTSPPPYQEGNGEDLYFNCADIVLKGSGSGSGGAGAGGASGGAGPGSGGAKSNGGSAGASAGGVAGASDGGRGGQASGGQSSSANGGSANGGSPGSGGNPGSGGALGAAGTPGTGGATGAGGVAIQGGSSSGGAPMNGGAANASGGSMPSDNPSDEPASGCSFRVSHAAPRMSALWLVLGLTVLLRRRVVLRTRA